jgi:hypothetical protein
MLETRHYEGEQYGLRLVQWLNTALNQRQNGVQLLFESVLALNQTLAQGSGAWHGRQARELQASINEQMSRCIDHYECFLSHAGSTFVRTPTGKQSYSEHLAVAAIVELSNRQLLDRVRLCDNCQKKWLFARFSTQRFCSERCRMKEFSSRESFKAERREYMRKRYWTLKRMKAKRKPRGTR